MTSDGSRLGSGPRQHGDLCKICWAAELFSEAFLRFESAAPGELLPWFPRPGCPRSPIRMTAIGARAAVDRVQCGREAFENVYVNTTSMDVRRKNL